MMGLRGILLLLLLIIMRCDGCIEEERVALLNLYSSISDCPKIGDDNCCKWHGVECSSSSGRVTLLVLYQISTGFEREGEWYFNASLFLPFHHLTSLDLTFLPIVGCLENQGFERLSMLKRLNSLYLGTYNIKDKSILSSIGTISSLRSIFIMDLGFEWMEGIQGLLRLENLESIGLSGDRFNNSIFSFLSGLPSLRSLSLQAFYGFNGTIDSTELSKLAKLEALYLGFDGYNNSIPSVASLSSLKTLSFSEWEVKGIIDLQYIGVSNNLSALYLDSYSTRRSSNFQLQSLGAYPNLKTISLIGNNFEGPIFIQEKGKLSNAEELDLSGSSINAESFHNLEALPSLKRLSLSFQNGTLSAQGFPNLRKLEYLDMSVTALNNSMLKDIGNMISLKTLSLSGCGLSGSTTFQSLCKLKHLEELYIGENELSGSLPWCIANLTSLQVLHLSSNHFTGSISMSPLRSLTSLKDLRLASNLFQVPISLRPFFNHSKLEYLDVQDNLNIYEPEDEVHDSTPRFQLQTLILSSTHKKAEGFPKFLSHQHNLQQLDLSYIQLKGEFPYWLLRNNTKLINLNLANTSLIGSFNLSTHHKNLQKLDVSKNFLNSAIPRKIGQILPSLFELNLSHNSFFGSIPTSIGKLCRLIRLDLSSNELSGKIPEDFGIGCPALNEIVLSDNDFEGPILPNNSNWKDLVRLRVDKNYFSGNIPYNLIKNIWLEMLDASNNNLFGNIPQWIANMSSLVVLDLSGNGFFGSLPKPLGPSQIREVYLSENKLQGSLGTAFDNFSQLMALDLGHNNFTGKFPRWIGKLPELSYLFLNHNNLEGEIPVELCSLEQLSLLDLSNNNLSGLVPSCITPGSKYMKTEGDLDPFIAYAPSYMKQPLEFTTKSLTSQYQGSILKYISGMDLSCNNLSGPIPAEFGNLTKIQGLNLSYNSFTGHIPNSFSNLAEIESLDLSYNNLDGEIPTQILDLNFMSHFSVAHNNLSGRTPQMVGQFNTFDNSSYVGNPFLCGPPLTQTCSQTLPPPTPNIVNEDEGDDDGFMDMQSFYITFAVTYVVVLLSIGAVLYINPYWQRRWFYMIQEFITNCGYFIQDNVFPLFKLRA